MINLRCWDREGREIWAPQTHPQTRMRLHYALGILPTVNGKQPSTWLSGGGGGGRQGEIESAGEEGGDEERWGRWGEEGEVGSGGGGREEVGEAGERWEVEPVRR